MSENYVQELIEDTRKYIGTNKIMASVHTGTQKVTGEIHGISDTEVHIGDSRIRRDQIDIFSLDNFVSSRAR